MAASLGLGWCLRVPRRGSHFWLARILQLQPAARLLPAAPPPPPLLTGGHCSMSHWVGRRLDPMGLSSRLSQQQQDCMGEVPGSVLAPPVRAPRGLQAGFLILSLSR